MTAARSYDDSAVYDYFEGRRDLADGAQRGVFLVKSRFRPGDQVIYRRHKRSVSPGPRARDVTAARCVDDYSYSVDKFGIVREALSDGTLITRRGKEHVASASDPNLRHPSRWERFLYRSRFPDPTDNGSAQDVSLRNRPLSSGGWARDARAENSASGDSQASHRLRRPLPAMRGVQLPPVFRARVRPVR